ncbi:MAG: dihydrolipoyl dehydrogenase family protein [Acidaminococcaceae bacterium]
MRKYDVIIIGTGAGNIVLDAALKQGLQCAVIEKGKFGGTCLNRGCIPTKVLATAADYVREIKDLPKIGVDVGPAKMNWAMISKRVWEKIDENKAVLRHYQKYANLAIYQGSAFFTADKVLQVKLHDGNMSEEITADKIIINVGARTNLPEIAGREEAGYICSETLFGDKYPAAPYKSLIIVGGGPIGCEFAHIFGTAGTKVTIIQHNDRLLPKADEEISAQIRQNMEALGVKIYLNADLQQASKEHGQKVLTFKDRNSAETISIVADEIMYATGIKPVSRELKIENTAIMTDERGWIRTNEFLETSVSGVWAIGDINGQPAFRHKANYEGDILAHNLFSGQEPRKWRWARYDLVPAVTFTYPQVAQVGLTEAEAKAKGYAVKTGRQFYRNTAKGYALGLTAEGGQDGFVKLIVDGKTNKMLGVHVIGAQASLLIQPFVSMMNMGTVTVKAVNQEIASETVRELRDICLTRTLDSQSVISVGETMTPHPSLAEVIMWTQYYFEGK